MVQEKSMTRRVTIQQQRKWLQESLMAAVTPEDMQTVILMLINRARGGSIAAAKELLDRTLGKPAQEIFIETTQEAAPDDVRSKLAALLISNPELRGLLEKADVERIDEVKMMQEGVTPQSPDKFEVDNE